MLEKYQKNIDSNSHTPPPRTETNAGFLGARQRSQALKHKTMTNSKVIEILAKSEVKWEAKFGRTITLEEAKSKVKKKLLKLEKENNYPY